MMKQTGIMLSLAIAVALLATAGLSYGGQPAAAADERDGQHLSGQDAEPPPSSRACREETPQTQARSKPDSRCP